MKFFIQPVALNLKAVGGGKVDIVVLNRDHNIPAKSDILTHHLK